MAVKIIARCVFACIILWGVSCCAIRTERMSNKGQERIVYQVNKLTEPMAVDGNWNKVQWQKVEPLEINNYMGERPRHLPKAQAKLLYDDKNIYVIFRVEDQYVRAVARETHGPVWEDSCVEFFFTPDGNVENGYFNLEANCGGTILFHCKNNSNQKDEFVKISDCEQMKIAHSLPKIVDPEITDPITWTLEYRLPFEVIEKYWPITKPVPGNIWRANFYKCADKTSHPHWLTWSVVDFPKPKFHLPEFFGVLEFK